MLDTTIANFFEGKCFAVRIRQVVDQCIEFSHQHAGRKYKAPNRRKIGGQLLESAYEHTAAAAQRVTG
jgi:hypothetical protein